MAGDNKPTIIIRRKKKGGGEEGHHGGAWKIAYADFVTALLCVFIVLWLINVTDERQREGIADYFNPMASQSEASESNKSFFEGASAQSVEGENQSGGRNIVTPPITSPNTPGEHKETELPPEEAAEKLAEHLKTALAEESADLDGLADNVKVEATEKGLRIQIMDGEDFAMFEPGTAQMTDRARELLTVVNRIVRMMPQHLVVTGHTDARPYEGPDFTGNWALSAARANTARVAMIEDDVGSSRFRRIQGKGSRDPLKPKSPQAPANRRISVLLLEGTGVGSASFGDRVGDAERMDVTQGD